MPRSLKKGPFVCFNLYKKITKAISDGEKKIIKTRSRASTVLPIFVGFTIAVYNGKSYIPVYLTEGMVGHKLGEFSPTRKPVKHPEKKNSKGDKGSKGGKK